MREETDPTVVETRYDQRRALRAAPAAASSLNVPIKIVILGGSAISSEISHSSTRIFRVVAEDDRAGAEIDLETWRSAR
jgi:hypothetical protein